MLHKTTGMGVGCDIKEPFIPSGADVIHSDIEKLTDSLG